MRRLLTFVILLIITLQALSQEYGDKVLVFTKTMGFRHANIDQGTEALKTLGTKHGFIVDHTEDSRIFTDESLRRYKAVIFFSTTGDLFDDAQKAAFVRYIQAGNGFVGIHAASDTEHNWPWYGALVGGYFLDHPDIQHADLHILSHDHPATAHLPKVWSRKDEWYDFKDLDHQVSVLMTIDEDSYQGGKMGIHHPISWYHDYDGGRAFYTALGHTKESFEEPNFLQHILGGIRYAMGQLE